MAKSLMSWSGGKDCMMALHTFHKNTGKLPEALLTAYSISFNRVTMHGVPMELIQQQADSLGIPLYTLGLPDGVTDESYEKLLLEKFRTLKLEGFEEVVFGDIFLEDLRDYRIRQLEQVGLNYSFPIWKKHTAELIKEFVELGFKTLLVSINGTLLPRTFAGRLIDSHFLSDLPEGIDPCGENGEFHTFVYEGPHFKNRIDFMKGNAVEKKYTSPSDGSSISYWFTDLKVP